MSVTSNSISRARSEPGPWEKARSDRLSPLIFMRERGRENEVSIPYIPDGSHRAQFLGRGEAVSERVRRPGRYPGRSIGRRGWIK